MGSKVICVDSGYANAGVAVMEKLGLEWMPIELVCIQTQASDKKLNLRVADDNARRIAEVSRGIRDLVIKHRQGLRGMLVELPHAGGQNANALRAMAYSTGMMVAIIECFDLPYEFYSPDQTRAAAGVPRSSAGRDKTKKIVMDNMAVKYPMLMELFSTLERREHPADALATFEAGRHGSLVRLAQ